MFAMKTTGNLLFLLPLIILALAGCGMGHPAVLAATFTPTAMPTAFPSPTSTPLPSETPTVAPTDTFILQDTAALQVGTPCLAGNDQIQTALQAAIPKQFWGLRYQTNGVHPPSMLLFGVSSGETKTLVVQAATGFTDSLDLARFFYLHADGTLDSLWVTLGIASPDVPYYSFNELPQYGWHSSQEAQATLSKPGQVFSIGIADWYVYQDGIHWDQCAAQAQYTPAPICAFGQFLDKGGSAEFFSSGTPPESWFAFGWNVFPNRVNAYSFPFPNEVTFPEAACAKK